MTPPDFVTLCIAAGRKDKIRPGDILGAVTGEVGIPGSSVGKIDILEYAAYVAIHNNDVAKALEGLQRGRIKGRNFKVRKL